MTHLCYLRQGSLGTRHVVDDVTHPYMVTYDVSWNFRRLTVFRGMKIGLDIYILNMFVLNNYFGPT